MNTISIAVTDIGIPEEGLKTGENASEENTGEGVQGEESTQETPYRHLELRGAQIKEIEGKNRQLIMELWGNDIEFKRI